MSSLVPFATPIEDDLLLKLYNSERLKCAIDKLIADNSSSGGLFLTSKVQKVSTTSTSTSTADNTLAAATEWRRHLLSFTDPQGTSSSRLPLTFLQDAVAFPQGVKVVSFSMLFFFFPLSSSTMGSTILFLTLPTFPTSYAQTLSHFFLQDARHCT